jgi:predicted  nucleic acid-binding Zn-ribbon protein
MSQNLDEIMKLKQYKQKQIEDLYVQSKDLEKEYPAGDQYLTIKLEGINKDMEHILVEVRDLDAKYKSLLEEYKEHAGGLH